MKTKSKSDHVFEVRLWSKNYYGKKITPFSQINIFHGQVIDAKTKERIYSPADFMKSIETLYKKAEKKIMLT